MSVQICVFSGNPTSSHTFVLTPNKENYSAIQMNKDIYGNEASINRICAWVTGFRNLQKALLFALLQPNDQLKKLQDEGNFSKLLVMQEELKTMPFGDIWDEYCRRCGKPLDGRWYAEVEKYENEVLRKRG